MNVKQSILLIFHPMAAMFVNLQCYNVILCVLPNTRHEINDTLILVILVKWLKLANVNNKSKYSLIKQSTNNGDCTIRGYWCIFLIISVCQTWSSIPKKEMLARLKVYTELTRGYNNTFKCTILFKDNGWILLYHVQVSIVVSGL